MKVVPPPNNHRIKIYLLRCSIIAAAFFPVVQLHAQHLSWAIDSTITLIDGASPAYSNLHGGDTIYLNAGNRDKLRIRNFKGAADSPVIIINKQGVVTITTNDYYGISISNCRYIRFSGQGNSGNGYGIQIKKVVAGCGIGIGTLSSDIEIDHVSIENCSTEGIFAKTDPDCSLGATRDQFTQFNTSIHDNYIANTGNEGMYIGSSNYLGITVTCNGKDTVLLPPVLDGVKIYNNVVKYTGWDGIQVSSAPLHCEIFNNTISYDSQAEMPNQMSGIIMGGGSKCNCNNNLISDGKGDGIENHGLGGNSIYNNIIVNAGKTYLPGDLMQMKHGILVSDVSVMQDSAVNIFFNDIINPKSDGIRFQSIKGKHNLISSNLIINPGNYDLYEQRHTSFTGKDAYVMIPNAAADIELHNNYFTKIFADAAIAVTDYALLSGSPLINQGYIGNTAVVFDFAHNRRPVGGLYDIGAMEYAGGADTLLHSFDDRLLLFPNPVHNNITITYLSVALSHTVLSVYTISGKLVLQQYKMVDLPGIQQLKIDVNPLPGGLYIYSLQHGGAISYGKFIKL